jgi:hypothetical protein
LTRRTNSAGLVSVNTCQLGSQSSRSSSLCGKSSFTARLFPIVVLPALEVRPPDTYAWNLTSHHNTPSCAVDGSAPPGRWMPSAQGFTWLLRKKGTGNIVSSRAGQMGDPLRTRMTQQRPRADRSGAGASTRRDRQDLVGLAALLMLAAAPLRSSRGLSRDRAPATASACPWGTLQVVRRLCHQRPSAGSSPLGTLGGGP